MALSRNEWIKAQRLGREYWLYVVYGARPDGAKRLVIICDPARVLGSVAQEMLVVQGHRLPGEAIARAAKGT